MRISWTDSCAVAVVVVSALSLVLAGCPDDDSSPGNVDPPGADGVGSDTTADTGGSDVGGDSGGGGGGTSPDAAG